MQGWPLGWPTAEALPAPRAAGSAPPDRLRTVPGGRSAARPRYVPPGRDPGSRALSTISRPPGHLYPGAADAIDRRPVPLAAWCSSCSTSGSASSPRPRFFWSTDAHRDHGRTLLSPRHRTVLDGRDYPHPSHLVIRIGVTPGAWHHHTRRPRRCRRVKPLRGPADDRHRCPVPAGGLLTGWSSLSTIAALMAGRRRCRGLGCHVAGSRRVACRPGPDRVGTARCTGHRWAGPG